ncbi:hypothetical protein Dhaf_3569 [Desulfitobacterium hafniense DCB-2]|uniref:Uncharacterized protein n=2 Tax=root TaxID=1 RepID=B8FQC6_DESHD|nr:hypothetical protein [Desulfitobacterium hafniense]ACL21587.1 hypothetical protein Dhaf_3569 [Desulfitobacterium hafniense DCB-2]MEA5023269.1 hypothetical protein [Desulfitobacterium hafniense]
MKKTATLMLATFLLFFMSFPVSAEIISKNNLPELVDEISKLDSQNINNENIADLSQKVNSLTDKEFDDFIVAYLTGDKEFTKIDNLLKVGIIIQPPKKADEKIITQGFEARDLNIYVTATKRIGDPFYRLLAYYKPSAAEQFPASYDSITLSWDSSKGDFYSYNTSNSNYNSLKSPAGAYNGTLVFNSYDYRYSILTPEQYVAAYVTPIASGYLDFAVEYQHSFTNFTFSGTLDPSVTFSGLGIVKGSIGAKINWAPQETIWYKSDINAVNLP